MRYLVFDFQSLLFLSWGEHTYQLPDQTRLRKSFMRWLPRMACSPSDLVQVKDCSVESALLHTTDSLLKCQMASKKRQALRKELEPFSG